MESTAQRAPAEIAIALIAHYTELGALAGEAKAALAAGDLTAVAFAVEQMVPASTHIHALSRAWSACAQEHRGG
jgi:hypothetical protein